jgi:hypothetical protein
LECGSFFVCGKERGLVATETVRNCEKLLQKSAYKKLLLQTGSKNPYLAIFCTTKHKMKKSVVYAQKLALKSADLPLKLIAKSV